MIGLAAAIPVVGVLHGGKKSIIVGALARAVLAPIVWSTGIHENVLKGCLLRGWDAAGIRDLKMRSPEPAGNLAAPAGVNALAQDPASSLAPNVSRVSSGSAMARIVPALQDRLQLFNIRQILISSSHFLEPDEVRDACHADRCAGDFDQLRRRP